MQAVNCLLLLGATVGMSYCLSLVCLSAKLPCSVLRPCGGGRKRSQLAEHVGLLSAHEVLV
jgi:hypothetical protein